MRNRGLHRAEGRRPDPDRGAGPPGVPRVRLGGRGGRRPLGRPAGPQDQGAGRRAGGRPARAVQGRHRASATRAGRRTASRATPTPTRTSRARVAVVHNGIIENADELRAKLAADGVVFTSETDSEVLPHLIAGSRRGRAGGRRTRGARADRRHVRHRRRRRRASPACSSSPATAARSCWASARRRCSPPPTSPRWSATPARSCTWTTASWPSLRADGFRTFTLDARRHAASSRRSSRPRTRPTTPRATTHFMRKEIHEQPAAVERALRGRLDDRFHTAHLGGLNLDAARGAGDPAGEDPRLRLRVLRRARSARSSSRSWPGSRPTPSRRRSSATATRSSRPTPSTSRSASPARPTTRSPPCRSSSARAGGCSAWSTPSAARSPASATAGSTCTPGPEIAVASTKAFTSTAVVFALLALHLGRIHDLSPADGRRIAEGLRALPAQIEEILDAGGADRRRSRPELRAVSRACCSSAGYAAGRSPARARRSSRRSPTSTPRRTRRASSSTARSRWSARTLPTVAIVPDDELLDKNLSTLGEIRARHGPGGDHRPPRGWARTRSWCRRTSRSWTRSC